MASDLNTNGKQPSWEETMKAQFVAVAFGTALSVVGLSSIPSFAAKSLAIEACSKQWDEMKAAGKTEGKTWPSFWSQCSKDFAANNPSAATAPEKPIAKATLKSTATA